ncbi:DNA primase [Oribacterium sp. KHPX15]|nr:DNA primase [Oribacterium sp. KHPX15]
MNESGLTQETIDSFRPGYTGEGKRGLVDYLNGKGYLDDVIIEAGLAKKNDEDGIEDTFQNRVIIPVIDDENRVIGFSGRSVDDECMSKYLNTRKNVVFDSSSNVFGLDHAKNSSANYMILCEGYMDVMALHQAGYDMAVKPLGLEFTTEHANLIKKYKQDVIIAYDNDKYGRNAASVVKDILDKEGLRGIQIDLSPYSDPLEYITKAGKTAFEGLLKTVTS